MRRWKASGPVVDVDEAGGRVGECALRLAGTGVMRVFACRQYPRARAEAEVWQTLSRSRLLPACRAKCGRRNGLPGGESVSVITKALDDRPALRGAGEARRSAGDQAIAPVL
ncbi:MAG: hypothetical protein B7Z10_03730 [Rhodobacterales bacterium 32-66-7]|nr:MAG: hypothetical protein B7Z10_03730 [Rhodobacterales bacterium 32-66-7]